MLEIDCNCGWSGRAETKAELLERCKEHVAEQHPDEPRDETLLRAMIEQSAREVSSPS